MAPFSVQHCQKEKPSFAKRMVAGGLKTYVKRYLNPGLKIKRKMESLRLFLLVDQDQMPELVTLCCKIALIHEVGLDLQGNALYDVQAISV